MTRACRRFIHPTPGTAISETNSNSISHYPKRWSVCCTSIRQFRPLSFFTKHYDWLLRERCKLCNSVYTARCTLIPRIFRLRTPTHLIARTCTVIVNAYPHTEGISHWLAAHFRPKYSSPYYFGLYGIVPLVPEIQAYFKRNYMTRDSKRRQLEGLTINFCGK